SSPIRRDLRSAAGAAPVNSDAAGSNYGVTQAFAQAAEKLPPPPPARPSFQSMFTDRVNQPLAEKVNTLWGGTNAGAAIPKSGGEGV
ncbi:MAG: hypothetical protein WBV51_01525, partial [Pseudolabrys sp.]